MLRTILKVIFFTTSLTFSLIAQPANIKFDQIGLEQGLSQSTIYSIVQDAQGFMWFGTQDGLNRYDGYSIKIFKHKTSDSFSLADNSILSLLSDSHGDIWVGTIFGGLDRYVISENKFYHHFHSDLDSTTISDNRINVLYEDSKSNIWIGTPAGLDLYNRKTDTFTHFYVKENPPDRNNFGVNTICEDRESNLLVGTVNGVYSINLENLSTDSRVKNFFSDLKIYSGGDVTSLYVDNSGTIWIGTKDRLLESYNQETKIFTSYSNTVKGARPIFQDSKGNLWMGSLLSLGLGVMDIQTKNVSEILDLKNDIVNSLYEDKSGIIWIGTYLHGVFIYDPRNNCFKHYLNDSQNPNLVMAILEDNYGELWIGTLGNGLKHYDIQRKNAATFLNDPKNSQGLSSNIILSLAESPENYIWIGTVGGGLDRYNKKTGTFDHYKKRTSINPNGLSGSDITALYADKNGDLWIGYYSGEIDIWQHLTGNFKNYYSKEKNASSFKGSTVTVFREDSNGTIWIGTHGSGLMSYFPESDSFKQYQIFEITEKQKADSESPKEISTIYIDEERIIWLGTDKSGLIKFDLATNSSTFFTVERGSAENVIYGILPDDQGNIWFSTNNGIYSFNPKNSAFRNFDKNNGLQSNEFNQGAYFKSSKGEMFFGGVNGFNAFYPEQISENEYIPPVYLTTIKVFDKALALPSPIADGTKLELTYSQNFFSFDFVALNFTSPQKNKYAYKLEGFDKDWHYVSASQRYASYTNLDPGEYVLRVRGSNNDGIWNETGASININISPPFWMRWWFRILLAVTIIGILILIYEYRVKQLLKIERIRFQIATDLHDDIGTSLTGIALFSDLAKQEIKENTTQAVERLDRIAQSSRSLLEQMNDIVWFIKPENDSLQSAILRMSDTARSLFEAKGIEYRTNIVGEIDNVNLSMEQRRNLLLIFKEMINNVLKHSQATKVKIDLILNYREKDSKGILISLTDNGNGFILEKVSNGNGLKNMHTRAKHIGAKITINTAPGNGTHIELFAPFKIT